jgi:AraC-like DNA-binding protein
MIFLQSPPHHALQNYIYQYWYLATTDPSEFGHLKQMMFPVDFGGLSFYFLQKPILQHYKNNIRKEVWALYTGLITSPCSITFQPKQYIEAFVVAFLPHGFSDLFQIDVSTTTDRLPDFFGLCNTDGKKLYKEIEGAQDFEAKVKIADDYFIKKLPETDNTRQIKDALQKIINSNGMIDMKQLASEVNMSWSSLERHFKKRIGVSPKMYARFKRFHFALALLTQPSPKSWVEIAHTCGYYDQAHLIREFYKFTNQKPSAFSVSDYPLFYRFIIEKK